MFLFTWNSFSLCLLFQHNYYLHTFLPQKGSGLDDQLWSHPSCRYSKEARFKSQLLWDVSPILQGKASRACARNPE